MAVSLWERDLNHGAIGQQSKDPLSIKSARPTVSKILSKFMEQTTMGVRQKLTDTESKGRVAQTETKK